MAIFGYDLYGTAKYGSTRQIDFGVDPFVAESTDLDTVRLTWNEPSGNWDGFRVLRSRQGYAAHETDGTIVLDQDASEPTPGIVVDTGLLGGWHYYTIMLRHVVTGRWTRTAIADVMVPYDYDSTAKMWSLIPEYYRYFRDSAAGYSQTLFQINPKIYRSNDQSVENEQLESFLSVFGWGLDTLRSQAESVLYGYDTNRIHVNRLALLAEQFGADLEPSVPASHNRNLVRNLALIYRKRGTLSGLRELLSLTTGWDVDVTVGPNMMLSLDQSTFINPEAPTWDPYTMYKPGDIVRGQSRRFYRALKKAYGPLEQPEITRSNNEWWESTVFEEGVEDKRINRYDTGDVGTWQVVVDGVVRSGSTSIGRGFPDPITGEAQNVNALRFWNDTNDVRDAVVRSIPRYTDDPDTFRRRLTLESAIPVPQVTKKWVAGTYYAGDRVLYKGVAYEAKTTTSALPDSGVTWEALNIDERTRINFSFYAHGAFKGNSGEGGVMVYPYFLYFDESGEFLKEVTCDPNTSTGAFYDPFTGTTPVADGRALVGGSWTSDGTGAWTPGYDSQNGSYAFPTESGRTLQVVESGNANTNVAVTFKSVGDRDLGVVFRYSDDQNFWMATATRLVKVEAGTATVVATWPTPFEIGQRLTVLTSTSNITVFRTYVDGSAVSEGTFNGQTFNQSATKHGIIMEA